jgi:hypothetical protein
VAYTVSTKPVTRGEVVAGKTVGLSVLLLAMLACVAAGGYLYMLVRASTVRARAERRLAEAAQRARHPSDLNALEGIIRGGPMQAYRYLSPGGDPEIGVRFSDGPPSDPAVRWALAGSGMRLCWDLSAAPIRLWWRAAGLHGALLSGHGFGAADREAWMAGAGRLLSAQAPEAGTVRLRLQVRPPPGEEARPVRVALSIVPHETRTRGFPAGPPPGRGLVQHRDLAPSSEVAVPLVPAIEGPPEDALVVPAEGGFDLETWLVSERDELGGYLLGAGAGALEVAGPDGRAFVLADPPASKPQAFGDRLWLAGRADLPRQTAVFRFADVPPSLLPAGDVAVELAFSLDARSPATVETTAEAVFVDPRTGRRQGPVRFTPEMYHASLVFVDRNVWRGGPLEVHVECRTDLDCLGLQPESVRLRLDGGPFAWNLAKAGLRVWLFGTVLVAAGVLFSTRVSWFVGILASLALFAVAMTRAFVFTATPLRFAAGTMARRLAPLSGSVDWSAVAKYVVLPVPDLAAMLPPESVSRGEVLSPAALGAPMAVAAVSTAAMVFLGTLLYRRREVAA